MAEGGEPGNVWTVGKEGLIFEYHFVGSHVAESGLVSAVSADLVQSQPSGAASDLADVSFVREAAKKCAKGADPPPPLLFLGRVLHASEVDVYTLRDKEGVATGVMLVCGGK